MPSAWQQSKRDRVSLLLHERMKKNFKIAISTLPYCMLWLSTNPFNESHLRKYHWFVCCHYSSHRHVINSMPQSDGVDTKAYSWSSRQTQHPLLYKKRKWRPVLVGNGKKRFIYILTGIPQKYCTAYSGQVHSSKRMIQNFNQGTKLKLFTLFVLLLTEWPV